MKGVGAYFRFNHYVEQFGCFVGKLWTLEVNIFRTKHLLTIAIISCRADHSNESPKTENEYQKWIEHKIPPGKLGYIIKNVSYG